jgi:hypothetical protein
MRSRRPARAPLASDALHSMISSMGPRIRHRPSPPSRAKRNIRWAAITMLALSLAPAGSSNEATPGADATLAAETAPIDELPWVVDGGEFDLALDHGADALPQE